MESGQLVREELGQEMLKDETMSTFLGQVWVFLLKEQYAREISANCPQNMFKCSIHVRPTMNPDVEKYALILSPSLRDNDLASLNRSAPLDFHHPMNFLIWNCRGSTSTEFRMTFRQLLDFHRPTLVVLLETHRANHQSMPNEFHFSNVASVPAEGRAGGISILWHADLLNVTDVACTPQEIHCMIQVSRSPNKWLFSAIYAHNDISSKSLLWDNLKRVADLHGGPWLLGGDFNEVTTPTKKFRGNHMSFS